MTSPVSSNYIQMHINDHAPVVQLVISFKDNTVLHLSLYLNQHVATGTKPKK